MQFPDDEYKQSLKLLAVVVCVTVFMVTWQLFFKTKHSITQRTPSSTTSQENYDASSVAFTGASDSNTVSLTRNEALSNTSTRVSLENADVLGSINLIGGVLDDFTLKHHYSDVLNESPVNILSPFGTKESYVIIPGWTSVSGISQNNVPNVKTVWNANNRSLTPSSPVELVYRNKSGQTFFLRFSIGSDYVINLEQEIVNGSGKKIDVRPFVVIRKTLSSSKKKDSYEGSLGFFNGRFNEVSTKKLSSSDIDVSYQSNIWSGFSDKYWLAAVIPSEKASLTFKSVNVADTFDIKVITQMESRLVLPSSSSVSKTNLFIGAKDVVVLDKVSSKYGAKLFSRSIDLGYLYFLTKPIMICLQAINRFVPPHNYGISIMIITIIIRLMLLFPSYKSYRSMMKLKALDPKVKELKEVYAGNKRAMDVALIDLYKKEKINPLASLFPLLMQIPFFIALYNALSVSIDLRHSVFISGWINDLSAPDPTTVFNLFGLLPIYVPSFLHIGALPLLMGLSMWLQQRGTSSANLDHNQAQVMKVLPFVLTFLFATFPAGLLVYWIVSNVFSFCQQLAMDYFWGVNTHSVDIIPAKK